MGFEPTHAEHIGLAVQRLNLSATSSVDKPWINVARSILKHVLEPHVQTVVTVWLYMVRSRCSTGVSQTVACIGKPYNFGIQFSKKIIPTLIIFVEHSVMTLLP